MKFEIRGKYWKNEKTFPGLNDYIHELGRNPEAGGAMKRKYEKIACDAVRACGKGFKAHGPISIHYTFYEPDAGQKRDHMNVFSFADKVIQDALQKCQVIRDDSPEYVDGSQIRHTFCYTKGMPRIEIEIVEI